MSNPDADVPTTQWSQVRASRRDSATGRAALSQLVGAYWTPIYHYLRRKGAMAHEAEDLTQGFFEKVLTGTLLDNADESQGRFRNYLAAAINRYWANQLRNQNRLKRGGGAQHLSFDYANAEASFGNAVRDDLTPEVMLQVEYYARFRERVKARVRADYEARNELGRFEDMYPVLWDGPETGTYEMLAERWQVKRNSVASAMRRFRNQWQGAAIVEAGETCAHPDDAVHEINQMKVAISYARRG